MSKPSAPAAEETRHIAIEHHDDNAPRFERLYREMSASRFSNAFTYGRAKVDVLLERELKRLPPGAVVLDAGCGTGAYLQRFAALGFTPVGVEPARGMLEIARRDNPGVRVEEGVMTALPLEDASVDFISVIEVFRYLDRADTSRGLQECFRVLKPGGIVFFTMVNRYALDGFWVLQRARQAVLPGRFTRKHPHCEFFTPDEARDELERTGFTNIRSEGRLFAPIRMVYRASPKLGASVARAIETADDLVHELPMLAPLTTPLAGHLICVAERPR